MLESKQEQVYFEFLLEEGWCYVGVSPVPETSLAHDISIHVFSTFMTETFSQNGGLFFDKEKIKRTYNLYPCLDLTMALTHFQVFFEQSPGTELTPVKVLLPLVIGSLPFLLLLTPGAGTPEVQKQPEIVPQKVIK